MACEMRWYGCEGFEIEEWALDLEQRPHAPPPLIFGSARTTGPCAPEN